jgi:DNA polymerase-4
MNVRSILHVDMDAFYASVEQLDNPELRGKPIIVGGDGNRGVVAAASYEVRKFGVHSAMPTRQAMQLCPHAICVRPRFDRYKAASNIVFEVFHEFTPIVEGLSLDEAFLDVTASLAAFGPAATIARDIKTRIHARTGLTASVGVAPNKLVAKIASDLRKPDGLVVVEPHEIQTLLDPLSIRRLFGIGNKTAPHLEQLGINTLGDLRAASEAMLQPIFGRYAARIRARAAGIDERPVIADWDEKQISAEETFDTDLTDRKRIHAQLAELADRMAMRLRHAGWLAGCIVVKIRRKDFKTYTRQTSIRPITNETKPLATAAGALLDEWLAEQPRAAVRLLGIGARDLTLASQLDMFAAPTSQKNQNLDATLDNIRAKFGKSAVERGSSVRTEKR